MTRPSDEEQARELAATTGRSYDDALRLVHISHRTRLTVAEAAFALGHPLAVLADGPGEPVVVGTSGLGPLSSGTCAWPTAPAASRTSG